MKYLILLVLFVATFHFVYEAIVAPSLRLKLRNKLFSLRDELRSLKIAGISKEDEQAFWLVHEGINAYINRLPNLTVYGRHKAMAAYREDAELRARVEKRLEVLNNCRNQTITNVLERVALVVEEAFLVNMGGTFVYIVPAALVAVTLGSLKRLAKSLVLTPEKDTPRVVPQQA